MPGLTGDDGVTATSRLRLTTGALSVPGIRDTPGHRKLRVSVEQGVDIPGRNYQIIQ